MTLGPPGTGARSPARAWRRTWRAALLVAPWGMAGAAPLLSWPQAAEQQLRQDPALAATRLEVEALAHEPVPPPCRRDWQLRWAAGQRWPGLGQVSLQCTAPAWQGTVTVRVRAFATVVAAAHPLRAGQLLEPQDLAAVEAELGTLPGGAVRTPDQAIGREITRAFREQQVLTLNALRAAAVIKAGERVSVRVIGSSFQVSADAVAQQAGAPGETVRIKLRDGRQLNALVVQSGVVELKF